MRVLVTGGAGYIGSVLCGELLKRGHDVTAVDNFVHGIPSLSRYCEAPNFTLIRGDVCTRDLLKSVLENQDAIIPLAAVVGQRQCDANPSMAYAINQRAIEILMELKRPDQRVLYPNTNSGYGTSGEPICTEESELRPISIYGLTKMHAEKVIRNHPGHTVFRLATAFGMSSRMRWDLMVNDFVYRAVHDRVIVLFEGGFRRNFIHVQDVARAFSWALDHESATRDQVFNLGLPDANLTKRALAELISHKMGCVVIEAGHASDPDKRDYYVANDKILAAGFVPVWGLEYGIDELVKGAKQWGV